MALEIYSREYAQGVGGFAALLADFKNAISWANIDDTTSDTAATLKMYDAADGTQNVGVYIAAPTDGWYCAGNVQCTTGATTYSADFGTDTNHHLKFANWAKWDGGFNVHLTGTALPVANQFFVNIGVCSGSRMLGHANKWCAWVATETGIFLASDTTTSDMVTPWSIMASGKISVAHPVCSRCSDYVPDNVLWTAMVQDAFVNTAGFCMWNGRRYYKNGSILIPTE